MVVFVVLQLLDGFDNVTSPEIVLSCRPGGGDPWRFEIERCTRLRHAVLIKDIIGRLCNRQMKPSWRAHFTLDSCPDRLFRTLNAEHMVVRMDTESDRHVMSLWRSSIDVLPRPLPASPEFRYSSQNIVKRI